MTLRYDFVSTSPASRSYGEVPLADQVADLRREVEQRRRYYPARIAKGAMTQDEAAEEIGLFEDIAADLDAVMEHDRAVDARAAGDTAIAYSPAFPLPRRDAAFAWEPKVHALRREIALRRKFYPDWIAKGRISPDDAQRRIERIEATHVRLWLDLWGWIHPLGPRPRADFFSAEVTAWRHVVTQHFKRVEAAIGLPWDRGNPDFARSSTEDIKLNEAAVRDREPALI